MMELVFLFGADSDIQGAYEFYESCREGQGTIFMLHLDAVLTHLRSFPEIGPRYSGPYRRLLVPRFPYGVFYTVERNRIVVCGVIDLRQDPKMIARRLGGAS
jgi:plasmid stabilization system protein ParE